MRKIIFFAAVVINAHALLGNVANYNDLIFATIQACDEPTALLSVSFTNDIVCYKKACTNVQGQCAADLALAISLMHRVNHEEESVGNVECFSFHQSLVSNVVYCVNLDDGSWIKYAAAIEYICGLNDNNQQNIGFALSTNMLAKTVSNPPDMGQTNYWNAMSRWMKCPNETISTAFKMNAAIWLAEQNRWSEVAVYTNSLPTSAIEKFVDDLK